MNDSATLPDTQSAEDHPMRLGRHLADQYPGPRSEAPTRWRILFAHAMLVSLTAGVVAACAESPEPAGQELSAVATLPDCPKKPRQIEGTVYCDNKFTLWVNGEEVATDPVSFTPHQAVRVSFEWDGLTSITYALQCEDFASESGFEYIGTNRPQLGDGALIAEFDDGFGTTTAADDWRVFTATFGPTDASLSDGCSAENLPACEVEVFQPPDGWQTAEFDDSSWSLATVYTARQAGWGRPPTWSSDEGCCGLTSPVDRSGLGCDKAVSQDQCLVPRDEFSGSKAQFIWGEDLERDNRMLFRHEAQCLP